MKKLGVSFLLLAIGLMLTLRPDTALAQLPEITFEEGAGISPNFREWHENEMVARGPEGLYRSDADGDGDLEALVYKHGSSNIRISIYRLDGRTFDLRSLRIDRTVGCSGINIWVVGDNGSGAAFVSGTGLKSFSGPVWSDLWNVLIGAPLGGFCEAWIDDIDVSGGRKAGVLVGSGVPGKGLEGAPGLQKPFNGKSAAGDNAGRR